MNGQEQPRGNGGAPERSGAMSVYENFVSQNFENFLKNLVDLINENLIPAESALKLAAEGRKYLMLEGAYEDME